MSIDQKRNNIEELKINIKNADKIPQFTEETKIDHFLEVKEEHAELKDFSRKLEVKFSPDKGRYSVANAIIGTYFSRKESKAYSRLKVFKRVLFYVQLY